MSDADTIAPLPKMTVEQFLAWDSTGHVGKLELVEGQVRAMSPASGTHALVQARLAILIGSRLMARKSPCRVGTEAPISPRIDANDNVRAPDLAVTCAPVSADKLFPAPVLIVEVLSPWAEIFRREADGGWPQHGQSRLEGDGTVDLESIGVSFTLDDVYEGTHLAAQS